MKPPRGALTQCQLEAIKWSIADGKPWKLYWCWKGQQHDRVLSGTFYRHEVDLLDTDGVWWFTNYFHALALHLQKKQRRIMQEAPPG